MRLEDCAAEIRPRRPWEAVDLGCALVRRWAYRLLPAWWLTVFPVCFAIWALLWNHPFLCMLAIWWLQPVFERVPLHIMSRALFGVVPTPLEVLKEWPRLLFRPFWTYWFTIRFRSLITRSLHMPIRDLESATGVQFGNRTRLIERHAGHTASLITFICMLLQLALLMGLIALVFTFVPEIYMPRLGNLFELITEAGPAAVPIAVWRMVAFLYILASGIVQTIYVGAGFGLYINSRSHVEGWDIELTFRRLANRIRGQEGPTASGVMAGGAKAGGTSAGGTALGLALCLLLLPAALPPANAQAPAERSRETIDSVLDHPDFDVRTRVLRERQRQGGRSQGFSAGPIFTFIGYSLFTISVVLLVGGLVWLIIKFGKNLLPGEGDEGSRERPPSAVMGLSIAPESLPDDIITSARNLWSEDKAHEAVSLLYRGAISQLVLRESLPIRESDTESDCLRRSRELNNPSMIGYFGDLTRAWISTAYARRLPSESTMATLCEQWPFPREAT